MEDVDMLLQQLLTALVKHMGLAQILEAELNALEHILNLIQTIDIILEKRFIQTGFGTNLLIQHLDAVQQT
jgi:hypothetical protein